MPRYIQVALHRFQHSPPTRKEHASHFWEQPNYGATQKFTKAEGTSQKLPPERILRLKQTKGTLLFYSKEIDLTILVALGTTAAAQTSGTIETEEAIHKFLDYCSTHSNSTLRYKSSGMLLKAHSDTSYFSESQARIRAGFFSTWEEQTMMANDQMEQLW